MLLKATLSRLSAAVATASLAAAGMMTTAGASTPAMDGTNPDPSAPIHCTAPGHKPITVVVIHGAWADSSSWSAEIHALRQNGCEVRAADHPVENLRTDAKKVADFVATNPAAAGFIRSPRVTVALRRIGEAARGARSTCSMALVRGLHGHAEEPEGDRQAATSRSSCEVRAAARMCIRPLAGRGVCPESHGGGSRVSRASDRSPTNPQASSAQAATT
jgi:hypothetical protein